VSIVRRAGRRPELTIVAHSCVAKLAQATPKEMAQGGISCEQKHCMRWIADQREQSLCVNPASIMARPLTRKAGDGRQ
jgi:hypothetical protein